MSDDSPFCPNSLSYFPHFFDEEECVALAKWGTHAAALSNGTIAPANLKETQFLQAARSQAPPITRFQKIWVRYVNAIEIQTRLTESEKKLVDIASLLSTANVKNEQLEAQVIRLNKLWTSQNRDPNAGEGNLPKSINNSADSDAPLENSTQQSEAYSERPLSAGRRSTVFQPRDNCPVEKESFFNLIHQYKEHLLLRPTFIRKMKELDENGNQLAGDYLRREVGKFDSKSSDYAGGQEWGGAIKRRQYL